MDCPPDVPPRPPEANPFNQGILINHNHMLQSQPNGDALQRIIVVVPHVGTTLSTALTHTHTQTHKKTMMLPHTNLWYHSQNTKLFFKILGHIF